MTPSPFIRSPEPAPEWAAGACEDGTALRWYSITDSTNARALEWLLEGAPDGALVLCDEQTAGRGRQGRRWQSEGGSNLLLSRICRAFGGADRAPLVPLAAGLAVARVCRGFGVPALLKWPNDVRLGERKLAGVLAEAATPAGGTMSLVAGIGLNVNQTVFQGVHASSLSLELGRPLDRSLVLKSLIASLDATIAMGARQPTRLLADYRALLQGIGQTIRISNFAGQVEGEMLGIDDRGALRVRAGTAVHTFLAGDVTIGSGQS